MKTEKCIYCGYGIYEAQYGWVHHQDPNGSPLSSSSGECVRCNTCRNIAPASLWRDRRYCPNCGRDTGLYPSEAHTNFKARPENE
jgi:hypothetical protein